MQPPGREVATRCGEVGIVLRRRRSNPAKRIRDGQPRCGQRGRNQRTLARFTSTALAVGKTACGRGSIGVTSTDQLQPRIVRSVRGFLCSSPTPSESWCPAVTSTSGRTLTPAWVPEPTTKLALLLALLQGRCDELGEGWGLSPIPRRPSRHTDSLRRLTKRFAVPKVLEEGITSPIHAGILRRGRARGKEEGLPGHSRDTRKPPPICMAPGKSAVQQTVQ